MGDAFRNCSKMNGSDIIAKNNKWVPVNREEVSVYLHKCFFRTYVFMGTYSSKSSVFEFKLFYFNGTFLYPLKTSENLCFLTFLGVVEIGLK